MKLFKSLTLGTMLAGAMALSGTAQAETFITIGTGGQTGVYYQVGGAICRLVNRGSAEHDIKCTTRPAARCPTSTASAPAISTWASPSRTGSTMPITVRPRTRSRMASSRSCGQSSRCTGAVHRGGAHRFRHQDLRRPEGQARQHGRSGLGRPRHLRGGDGQDGWSASDFSLAAELKSAEQSAALCDNKIDAIVFTVGHPAGTIKEATTSCESRLINVDNDVIRKLVDDNPFYSMATIPAGMYAGTDEDTTTFGVGATFVSSTKTSPDVIYEVTKAVFENFGRFKQMHPPSRT